MFNERMETVESGLRKMDSEGVALPSHRNALLEKEISTLEFEKALKMKDKEIYKLMTEIERL